MFLVLVSNRKKKSIAKFSDNDHLEKVSRFFLAVLFLLASLLREVGSEAFLLVHCLTVVLLL